ncbi:MAG: aminodeoxychorismate synthase component I [Deltaproteobacteria bacterium]|nr:aminodeoxychorismate synthase component I [Deltaproteobacteria bacterium]
MAGLPWIVPLPYFDPLEDFAPYAPLQGSFFLDSSLVHPKYARFSFWGYNPKLIFESKDGFVKVEGHTTITSPFSALKEFYREKILNLPFDPYHPFCGGLVGFLSYEWGAALENIAPVADAHDLDLPDGLFGLYDIVVGYDHIEKTAWVASIDEGSIEQAEKLAAHLEANRKIPVFLAQHAARGAQHEMRSSSDKPEYLNSIGKILDYLRAGDCYQVNLAQRFMAPASLSPWGQYLQLRQASPAPYSCFLNEGSFQILSSSPECFLISKEDGALITRPIKGTRKRGETPEEDEKLRAELTASSKDQAELLMITDLERNDFGKICVPGSVVVPELRVMESFAQVHHLLSTVRGMRRPEFDIIDCLAAMMPGGSITGAPKIRAMEIIRELESVNRGIYTGIIGYIGPQNTSQFNIAIRTMIVKDATAYFHSGSGIVIDSDPQTEYEETLAKAKGMMASLGL